MAALCALCLRFWAKCHPEDGGAAWMHNGDGSGLDERDGYCWDGGLTVSTVCNRGGGLANGLDAQEANTSSWKCDARRAMDSMDPLDSNWGPRTYEENVLSSSSILGSAVKERKSSRIIPQLARRLQRCLVLPWRAMSYRSNANIWHCMPLYLQQCYQGHMYICMSKMAIMPW